MSGGEDVRVLHVDDDPDLGALVATQLERIDDDLDVVAETSAREGLARVEAGDVDCVVSDHDVSDMDGLDFLRAVRDVDEELPFVLFTGKGSESIAAEAITAGVTEYLQKGTRSDQYALLANRIRRAVGEQRAKAALEESERMLSTLIANLPGMTYRCRNEEGWPMTFVSEGAVDVTGYDAGAIKRGAVSWGEDVLLEDDREHLRNQVQRALRASEPFEVTYRIETRDGELRWVWERGRVVDVEGDVEILEGFITDITARKEREHALEAERKFTQTVINALDDVFYVVASEGDFLRWNDRLNEVTGYADEEVGQMVATDVFPEEYNDVVIDSVGEARATGSADFEAEILTKDGDRKPMEFRGTYVELDREELTGVCGIARDVTERKARERELGRYETVIQAVGDPVYMLDAEGVFTFVNEALETLSGYDADALLGEPAAVLLDDADVERSNELIVDLLREEDETYGTFEMDVVTASGEHVPCETHVAILPMDDGEFRGTAGVIRDISERKERERRLEEFASVVSHDLRNPLNVIQGRLDLAREGNATEHLDAVEDAATHMEQFIDELLTLARQGEGVGDRREVALEAVARRAWNVLDAPGADLVLDAPGELDADPDRLRELFENLFRNAVEHSSTNPRSTSSREDAVEHGSTSPDSQARQDAVEHGSTNLRSTSSREDAVEHGSGGDDSVTVRVGATGEGFFVEDDGPGIPPDRRDVVLERGYTTSHDGTGFGLAIVADVVDAHDWDIDVTEGTDGGARFEISV